MSNIFLAIIQPARLADGSRVYISLDDVQRHLAARLDELPSLRWRIVAVPGRLHHPMAVNDPDFQLEAHLDSVTLAAPGRRPELDRLCGAVAAEPLDRRRPLWRLILVNGLEDGRQALVMKTHHCLMDGVATMTTLSLIFTGQNEIPLSSTPWRPEAIPRASGLVIDALRDHRRTVRRLGPLIRKTARNWRAMTEHQRRSPVKIPRVIEDTPWCSLNDAFGAERVFRHTQLALADVKLVQKAAVATVTDVLLAIVAEALRRYLSSRDDLPERPLVATVPFSLDPPDAPPRQFGNRLAGITTSLATDVEDVWERLQTIHTVTEAAKRSLLILGPELWEEWLELIPPFVAVPVVRRHHRKRQTHRDKANVNITVSSLRGPLAPWSFGDGLAGELYLCGPPNNGVGSTISIWSYGEKLLVGILAFADSLLSPDDLLQSLHDALSELVQEARNRSGAADNERTAAPASDIRPVLTEGKGQVPE